MKNVKLSNKGALHLDEIVESFCLFWIQKNVKTQRDNIKTETKLDKIKIFLHPCVHEMSAGADVLAARVYSQNFVS